MFFTQGQDYSVVDDIHKKIRKLKEPIKVFMVSPYPTFKIKVNIEDELKNGLSSKVDDPRISELNANIYLTLLNSMDISTTPTDRQTFVLPLQMIGDNEYDRFKTALHQVLCSYPDLKSIYVPFEDALLVIHVVASRFSFYSNGELDKKNKNSMELIRKSLIVAAKDTSNYSNTVLTEGVRLPSIENQLNYETYMCEDELAVVN